MRVGARVFGAIGHRASDNAILAEIVPVLAGSAVGAKVFFATWWSGFPVVAMLLTAV